MNSASSTGPSRNVNGQKSQFKIPYLDRGKYLLQSGLYADCEFLVGDGTLKEVIKAHKIFLSLSSPVFNAMFFGKMTQAALGAGTKNQTSSLQHDPIAVPDVTPTSFKSLLQHIYTDSVDIQSVDQAMGLCYAAQKYDLPDLVTECLQYVEDNLIPECTIKVLEFTNLFEDGNLKEKCFSLLRERTLDCLASSDFEDAQQSTVLAIVKEEGLNIRELELFDAVKRWAKHQCTQRDLELIGPNLRLVLKEIIKEIRFLAMTSEEFASSPVHSGILTENEWAAIFVHLNNPDSSRPMPIYLSSNRNQRQSSCVVVSNSVLSSKLYCLREVHNETRVLLEPSVDYSTALSVDKDVMITGIILADTNLSNKQRFGYQHMELVCTVYATRGYYELIEGSAKIYKPMNQRSISFSPTFDRPLHLQRGISYRICISVDRRAYFLSGTTSDYVYSHGIHFFFESDDEDRDGVIRGLIFTPC